MSPARILYRVRQFAKAVFRRPAPEEIEIARRVLSPAQFSLFAELQPGEQAHSLDVLQKLAGQGEDDPDLLAAALLHDAGKSRFPLRLWERVLIVLIKRFSAGKAQQWGAEWQMSGSPRWKRPFAVALLHPAWGAEMSAQAGTSPQAVTLIRCHQDLPDEVQDDHINSLLRKLQAADDES